MPKAITLAGRVYGRLTVIRFHAYAGRKKQWVCTCACGNETIVLGSELTRAKKAVRSCGCLQIEIATKHGMHATRVYRIWRGMLNRCYNQRAQAYKHYGAKGVDVCSAWRQSFAQFVADMGDAPPGLSIDRIDNKKGYSPDNCRWATPIEQGRNQTTNKVLCVGAMCAPVSFWTAQIGVARSTIAERIKRGWSVEDACTRPPCTRKGAAH